MKRAAAGGGLCAALVLAGAAPSMGYLNAVSTTPAFVTVCQGPHDLRMSQDGSQVYVACAGDGLAGGIRVTDYSVWTSGSSSGGSLERMVESSGSLYLTNGLGIVSILSTSTHLFTGQIAQVGVAPFDIVSLTKLYVSATGSGAVVPVDPTLNSALAPIPVGGNPAGMIVIGTTLYVADSASNQIVPIPDPANGTVGSRFSSGATGLIDLASDPSGSRIFASHVTSGVVTVVYPSTGTVAEALEVGIAPRGMRIYKEGSETYLLVALSGESAVAVWDLGPSGGGPYRALTKIPVGSSPEAVEVGGGGTVGYVANAGSNTVQVLVEHVPTVQILSVENRCMNGTTATQAVIDWTTDTAGAYTVEVGGNGTVGSGTTVATGDAAANQTSTTVVNESVFGVEPTASAELSLAAYVYVAGVVASTPPGQPLEFDTIPPSMTVSNLTVAGADTGSLRVAWEVGPNPLGDVSEFRIDYGTVPGPPYGNEVTCGDASCTSQVLGGLDNGVTYYVAVRAADCAGNVGPLSAEISGAPVYIPTPADLAREKGGCFIATAAFGGPDAPEVRLLRGFRDRWLRPFGAGRAFVAWYERTTPPWAAAIRRSAILRGVVGSALLPLLLLAEGLLHPRIALMAMVAFGTLLLLMLRPRRVRLG